jgi:hypothetical protein
VRESLDARGDAAVAISRAEGTVVLPGSWTLGGPDLYAIIPRVVLELAGPGGPEPRVAVAVDRPSTWRAREMVGAMVQGVGEALDLEHLRSGRASAERIARSSGADPGGASLLRVHPSRLVWWRGWTSGSAWAP